MPEYQKEIGKFIDDTSKKAKIPGLAAVVIRNNKTFFHTYGMADIRKKIRVDECTLFEIGSMSKAFTIMGIFLLKTRGQIDLNDKVSKYVTDFYLCYKKRRYDCTISDLVYHRSGIPFEQVHHILPGDNKEALKTNCKKLIGLECAFVPGSNYLYSSSNIDLLAYIIECVTSSEYETYISKNVLVPLGLNNTYLFRNEAAKTQKLSQGYRYSMLKPRAYDTEVIRGNVPAAYMISSISDMERWLKINMKAIVISSEIIQIIDEMCVAQYRIDEKNRIGAGWNINNDGVLWFRGNNPNYQSAIMLDRENQIGVCILTNICTSTIYYIIENIFKIPKYKLIPAYKDSPFKRLDKIFTIIDIMLIIFIMIIAISVWNCKNDFHIDIRYICMWTCLFLAVNFLLHIMPNFLADYKNISWKIIKVWASKSIYYFRYLINALFILSLISYIF